MARLLGMKMRFLAIAAVWTAFAQTPAFEVASVKPCTPEQQGQLPIGLFTYPGGRIRATNETLRQLIHDAYGLEMHQILGGPAWLDSDRWIVEAKALESSAGKPEMRQMLQTLLADRFGLKVHRETKTESVYALVVAKGGPKLKPPKDSTRSPFVGAGRTGPVTAEALSQTFSGQNATMDQLAYRLSQHLRRPVTNKTGIEGHFDFFIEYSGADSQTTAPPLDRAIQDQVGLKLVTEPGSVEVVVVDGASKPTAN
jgi:uncharacterized protein (TIGR03435 family)